MTKTFIASLLIVGLSLLPSSLTAASDRGSLPSGGEYPSPSLVMSQTRGDASAEENYRTDISFVNIEEREAWTWGPSGRYEATIKIDRYYGTRDEIRRMQELELMPEKALLVVPANDCDFYGGMDLIPPERDLVYLNGHYVGTITGDDNIVNVNFFRVPVSYLNLPANPGDVAENKLEIIVDTLSDVSNWVLGQQWQMIILNAPAPAFLVHGWTNEPGTLSQFKRTLSKELGIPSELASVPDITSPMTNGMILAEQLKGVSKKWGVKKFNIVGHSKGGLDGRALIDGKFGDSTHALSLIQLGTPNLGSVFADVILNPQGILENIYATLAEQTARGHGPGLDSLTTAQCAFFNRTVCTPEVPIRTIIGQVDKEDLTWTYARLNDIVDMGGPNDGIVTVASAHCLGTAVSSSPLYERGSSKYTHSGIVREGEGAPDVVRALRGSFMVRDGDIGLKYPVYVSDRDTRGGLVSATSGIKDTGAPQILNDPNASLESAFVVLEKGELCEGEFSLISGGDIVIGVFGSPHGTTALLYPPGSSEGHAFESDPEGLPYMSGQFLSLELSDAPAGKYRIVFDCSKSEESGVAKVLAREREGLLVFEVTPHKTLPPTSSPLVTARALYNGKPIQGDDGLVILLHPRLFSLVQQDAPVKEPQPIMMHDDGKDGDEVAGDGVYSAYFAPGVNGIWGLEAEMIWQHNGGEFHRSTVEAVDVLDCRAEIATPLKEAVTYQENNRKNELSFTTEVSVSRDGNYGLYATLLSPSGLKLYARSPEWKTEGADKREVTFSFDLFDMLATGEREGWVLDTVALYWDNGVGAAPSIIKVAEAKCSQPLSDKVQNIFFKSQFTIKLKGTGTETLKGDEVFGQTLQLALDVDVEGEPDMMNVYLKLLITAPSGRSIATVPARLSKDDNGNYVLNATLENRVFANETENGPYTITGGLVGFLWDINKSMDQLRFVEGEYKTKAYDCRIFHKSNAEGEEFPGENLKIDVNQIPDEEGFHEVRLSYSPGQPPVSDYTKYYLYCRLGPDAMGTFEPYTWIYVDHFDGMHYDVTEQVLSQLPAVGNGDNILDPGEEATITIHIKPLNGNKLEEIAQSLSIRTFNKELSGEEMILNAVYHCLDRDLDLSITRRELDFGRRRWVSGDVSPHVLLEAVELATASNYFFNTGRSRFEPLAD